MNLAKNISSYVAIGTMLGCFILLLLILFAPLTVDKDAASTIIGAVITLLMTVVNYFFGSSAGSAKKNEIVNDALKKEEAVG